jgi:hypothetical protein
LSGAAVDAINALTSVFAIQADGRLVAVPSGDASDAAHTNDADTGAAGARDPTTTNADTEHDAAIAIAVAAADERDDGEHQDDEHVDGDMHDDEDYDHDNDDHDDDHTHDAINPFFDADAFAHNDDDSDDSDGDDDDDDDGNDVDIDMDGVAAGAAIAPEPLVGDLVCAVSVVCAC